MAFRSGIPLASSIYRINWIMVVGWIPEEAGDDILVKTLLKRIYGDSQKYRH